MPSIHVLVVLIGLLLGRDLAQGRGDALPAAAAQFIVASGWVALVALVALVSLPACARAAAYRGSWPLLQRGLTLAGALRWMIVVPFAAWAVAADGAGCVEGWVGSWIGLDEALAAAPPILALLVIAWAEHPLHDRMRQAMLVRQLDEGGLVDRPPTRAEATMSRARMMLAMPLVPVMVIVCWHEMVDRLFSGAPSWLAAGVDTAGAIAIVLVAPAVIVRVLGTRPLGDGPLRERINELCGHMRTRVRGVRLWDNASANAAVLGLLPFARYMLITEPLVRGMPRHELDAVMAHELAHVRQHHVLWIVLTMLAVVTVLSLAQAPVAGLLEFLGSTVAEAIAFACVAALAIHLFGVVSRMIERHADARAAVAVGEEIAAARGEPSDVVHPGGPASMSAALSRVCVLNGVHPDRWGFRHGSVTQRQRALARLAGVPVSKVPIDRTVRALRRATLLVLLGIGVFTGIGLAMGWLVW